MADLLIALLCALMALSATDSTEIIKEPVFDKENCTCNGIPLYGNVEVVNSNADFRVQIVNSFENLMVEKVNSNALKCGEWIFVNSNADFTIEFVNSNPDFTIRYVETQPGIHW